MDEHTYKEMGSEKPSAQPTYAQPAYPTANATAIPTAVQVSEPEHAVQVVNVVYVAAAPVHDKMSFLRKVFGTLSLQLVVTFAIVLAFFIPGCPFDEGIALNCTETSIRYQIQTSVWIFWVVFVGWAILYIVCVCFQWKCRKPPGNYIVLSVFTIGTGVFLGVLACYSSLMEVIIAMILTILISFSLIALTCMSFVRGFVGPAPYIAIVILAGKSVC